MAVASHMVARLEHLDLMAGFRKFAGYHRTGKSGTYDCDAKWSRAQWHGAR
jgi:hypothetical protein